MPASFDAARERPTATGQDIQVVLTGRVHGQETGRKERALSSLGLSDSLRPLLAKPHREQLYFSWAGMFLQRAGRSQSRASEGE
jgi:hypothetical protein